MKKSIQKIILLSSVLFVSVSFSSSIHAAQCGAGTIVDIKEGGWNTDDFMIKLEGPNSSASSLWQGYVRFKSSDLSATRMESIRRLAATAFALDAKVWTYSHNGTCTSTTEISIVRN